MQDQPQLPGAETPETTSKRTYDYLNLFPRGVMPSGGIDVLEQGEHLLFIKSMAERQEISPKQRHIWTLLVRHGEIPDSPGSITVVCVWGMGLGPRRWITFDYLGDQTHLEGDRDSFRNWLLRWFNDHGGKRR